MKTLKVMIVDDHIQIVEGLAARIDWQQLGSPVVFQYTDPLTALKKAQEETVDLVLSDICIPGMSGLEMSKRLLHINPRTKIIFISGYADYQYAVEAVHMHAIDYIEKPVDFEKLMTVMSSAVSQIHQEERNAELLRSSLPVIKERFFLDLIQTGSRAEAALMLDKYSELLRLDRSDQLFLCISILVHRPAPESFDAEDWQIRILNLMDTIQVLFSNHSTCYPFRALENIYLVVGSKDQSSDRFHLSISQKLQLLIARHRNELDFCCGIGDTVSSMEELHQSYVSAQQALNFRFFLDTKIFDMQRTPQHITTESFPVESFRETLLTLILKKNVEGIHRFLNAQAQILPRYFKNKNVLLICLFSVLYEIVRFIRELGNETEALEDEISRVFEHPERLQSTRAVLDWLEQLCGQMVQVVNKSIAAYHSQLCNLAARYIKSNYKEASICLDSIAAYVNISPAYLSVIFKKEMGQNITDRITELRIEKAKDLLTFSNLPVKDISQTLGYSNQFYFSAIFKKHLGMSPSAYREENQQKVETGGV